MSSKQNQLGPLASRASQRTVRDQVASPGPNQLHRKTWTNKHLPTTADKMKINSLWRPSQSVRRTHFALVGTNPPMVENHR